MSGTTDFLEAPARQAAVVGEAGHRPWPLPDAPWLVAQTWDDLGFLHWRVDPEALRPLVPEPLELQTFDGSAWLGITPFRVGAFRLRGLPPLPLLSSFGELNVRTYVEHDGRPGIWFLGLEAGSRPAVEAARRLYGLPYRHARVDVERRLGWTHVDSSRPGAVFSARYRGEGDVLPAEPGSLEHFLTERYCLYSGQSSGLGRVEIHHLPWSLQRGEAEVELNTVAPVALPDEPPLVHVASRLDAVVWAPDRIRH